MVEIALVVLETDKDRTLALVVALERDILVILEVLGAKPYVERLSTFQKSTNRLGVL